MKPMISYYGGKQSIASKIIEYLPPHRIYVEPFCGGAAVFFAKGNPCITNAKFYREILNDKSDLLINLYKVAIEQKEPFYSKIQATLFSQSDYNLSRTILNNEAQYTNLEKAWAYYVNINTSFANKINGGWKGLYSNHKNLACEWKNKKLHLEQVLKRLEDITISCEDAITCIKRWDSPETLFYCDPPYLNTNMGHYKGFSQKDYQALCETLDNIKGSYVLSGYPLDLEPKSCQKKIKFNVIMKASRVSTEEDRKRIEVLWIRDQSNNMSMASRKIIDSFQYKQLSLFS